MSDLKKVRLTLLGATGSVGHSTLDLLARHADRYEVVALTGASQIDLLTSLCIRHSPRYAVVLEVSAAERLSKNLKDQGCDTEVLVGNESLIYVATLLEVDVVVSAIVGVAGLPATLAAAKAGKTILLANKETLVLAGSILMQAVIASGSLLLPIDSEHNALFQCLPHPYPGTLSAAGVKRLLLTASGGPFRQFTQAQLETVTPHQALKHPNWSMGKKISIDCATLMNKGLEVIEAHWLFNAPPKTIDVVIHPQSVVHSLVEYIDGSVLAQLATPDMRTSIAYALSYPERIQAGVNALDLVTIGRLDFEAPDWSRFPCLRLAYETLESGGTAPAILNAANEVAVAAFLEGKIRFIDIARLNESVLTEMSYPEACSLETLLEVDRCAREVAHEWIFKNAHKRP